MAYLPQSTFQQRKNFLQNGGEFDMSGDTREGPEYDMSGDIRTAPAPTRAGRGFSGFGRKVDFQRGLDVGSGAAAKTTQPKAAAVGAPTTNVQASPSQALARPDPIQQPSSFQRQGTLQERLFQPLQTGAEQGQKSLGEAADFFRQEAGPSRTYEGIGAQDTLGRAFREGQAQDLEAARGLVGAQYGGPEGLDQQSVAALQNLVTQMQTRQKALGTGGGLQTLIQQSVSGLTPGQAQFEAKRRLPEAKIQARDIGFETVNPLTSRIMTEKRAAEEFAKQRTQEEQDIADRSRGFLTGERGKIEEDLTSKIMAAQQQQEREAREYQDVLGADEAGRLAALRAANPELAAQFDTEARRKDIEADQKFQQILADPRFASIKDIDPLELSITKRGKQFYAADGQDLRRVIPDKTTRALLYERQQELEKQFDPGTVRAFSKTAGPGEYSAFRPLYGEGGFEALDPVNYLGFDPGTRPSQENLSSAEQKKHFNNIQSILGNLDQIGEAEPFRAAQIFGEIDNYLEDEQKALEGVKGELSKEQKEWYDQVKKARKKARKAKSKEQYAKIAGVMNILPDEMGLNELAGGVAHGIFS